MSYSRLTWSIDPKIVGVKDGVGPCYLDENFYERHPWYTQIFLPTAPNIADDNWWKPRAHMPDNGAPLIRIPMDKKAYHTDFIDFAGFQNGYLVNTRLRDILERAHLPRHCYFPASLIQNTKEINEYWWLCYDLDTGENTVDFAKSEFDLDRHNRLYKNNFSIESYEDYLNVIRETGEAAQAVKLQFNNNFDKDLDIWGTQFLSAVKGYISDGLCDKFEQYNITGYSTKGLKCSLLFPDRII